MRGLLTGILVGLGLVAVAIGGAYVWLGHRATALLAEKFAVPLTHVAVPTDSASIAEGERLAWLRGCHGCHDPQLQGRVFLDEPRVARLVAPNVKDAIASYNDDELARLIRHGVRRDSTGVLVMPIASLYYLSDGDVGRIIAHLRAAPRVERALPHTELRIMGKLGILRGELLPAAATLDHAAVRPDDRADTTQQGRGAYLARTICAECHGATLRGDASTPPLFHATGYSSSEFTSLMLDGRSRSGRDLGLMGRTARNRFIHFLPSEIEALYAYLRDLSPSAPTAATAPTGGR